MGGGGESPMDGGEEWVGYVLEDTNAKNETSILKLFKDAETTKHKQRDRGGKR